MYQKMLRYEVLLFSSLFLSTCRITGTLEARWWCDHSGDVYVDGVYVDGERPSGDLLTRVANISDDAQIIAVKCTNTVGSGAIIASFDNGLVTDSSWRCSGQEEEGWNSTSFDDSDWNRAYVISDNRQSKNSSIPAHASYIWNDKDHGAETMLYCRGRLQPVVNITVFCHGTASVRIDGEMAPSETGSDIIRYRTEHPRLLAIYCNVSENSEEKGLIVSLSNGYVSSDKWEYRALEGDIYSADTVDMEGWYKLSLKTNQEWDGASVIGHNNGSDYRDNFNAKASWIMGSDASNEKGYVFRGLLGVQVRIRCDDRGTVYADGIRMFNCGNVEGYNVIPKATRVVSILGHNIGGPGYIAAAFSNGFETVNGSDVWKCSGKYIPGWRDVDFNDSTWEQATSREVTKPSDVEELIKIWTATVMDNSNVYCRGYINCGCEYQCNRTNDYEFECLCPNGYNVGPDGYACIDINECQKENGGCSHLCINTNGSYNCDCNDGFGLIGDNHTCNNVDECSLGEHNCSDICNDIVGSFQCDCKHGFLLQADNVTCEDIDECNSTDTKSPCSHSCINTKGSYFCSCPDGMTLDSDGVSCQDAEGSSMNIALIAGAVVSVVVLLIVIGVLLFILLCYRKRRKQDKQPSYTEEGPALDKRATHVYYNVAAESVSDRDTMDIPYEEVGTRGRNIVGLENADSDEQNGKPTTLVSGGGAAESPYEEVGERKINVEKEEEDPGMPNGQPIASPRGRDRGVAEPPYEEVEAPKGNVEKEKAESDIQNAAPSGRNRGMAECPYEEVGEGRRKVDKGEADSDDQTEEPIPATPPPRQKPALFPKSSKPKTTSPSSNVYGNVSSDELLSKPIAVSDLASCIGTMRQNGDFVKEFKRIPSGQREKCQACDREGIVDLIRFQNIKPYDHSIVPLTKVRGKPLSDFINASFLHGYEKPNFYIASQGPLKVTTEDHWRMIWEHDVKIIVMLTNFSEARVAKCARYFPQHGQKQFGDFLVEVSSRELSTDFTISTFSLSRAEETRKVLHFHYTSWPDKDVPDTGTSLLQLRELVKQAEQTEGPPVLVHCSAGVGRTGAYIAIDYLLEQAEAEGHVDVCGCVNLMRENRMNMIQSTAQYYFVHTTILEALLVGSTEIQCSKFSQALANLYKLNPVTQRSGFQEQFKLLETLKHTYPDGAYSEARLPENNPKNIDPSILPLNGRRVFLLQRPGMESDYINAVFADGYRSRNEFIITQMPNSNTCVDFWRMVNDFGASIIVMLDAPEDQHRYYPDSDQSLTFGPFVVRTDRLNKTDVVQRRLELNTDRETVNVYHLEPIGLTDGASQLDEAASLIALFSEVQKLKQKYSSNSPIVVQCSNGAEKSGLFCAMYVMLDKLNAEQVVDIFNSVKKIRADRSQLIGSEKQYVYLHEIARAYMESFSTYANFK